MVLAVSVGFLGEEVMTKMRANKNGKSRFDVVIVGGVIAGCASGILLSEKGLSVLLLEQKKYPFHKVCGEFLSPESQQSFRKLGLQQRLKDAGMSHVYRTKVTAPGGPVFEAELPGTAMGLSRYRLDALMAEAAQESGCVVQDGTAVSAVSGTLSEGFETNTKGGSYKSLKDTGGVGRVPGPGTGLSQGLQQAVRRLQTLAERFRLSADVPLSVDQILDLRHGTSGSDDRSHSNPTVRGFVLQSCAGRSIHPSRQQAWRPGWQGYR